MGEARRRRLSGSYPEKTEKPKYTGPKCPCCNAMHIIFHGIQHQEEIFAATGATENNSLLRMYSSHCADCREKPDHDPHDERMRYVFDCGLLTIEYEEQDK